MKDILDVLGVKKDGSYKKRLVYTFCKEYLLRWYLIFGIVLFVFVYGIPTDSPEYFVFIASFLIIGISFISIYLSNKYDVVDIFIVAVLVLFYICASLSILIVTPLVFNDISVVPKIAISYTSVLVVLPSILGSFLFFKRFSELEKELREHGKGKTRIINLYNFIGSAKSVADMKIRVLLTIYRRRGGYYEM